MTRDLRRKKEAAGFVEVDGSEEASRQKRPAKRRRLPSDPPGRPNPDGSASQKENVQQPSREHAHLNAMPVEIASQFLAETFSGDVRDFREFMRSVNNVRAAGKAGTALANFVLGEDDIDSINRYGNLAAGLAEQGLEEIGQPGRRYWFGPFKWAVRTAASSMWAKSPAARHGFINHIFELEGWYAKAGAVAELSLHMEEWSDTDRIRITEWGVRKLEQYRIPDSLLFSHAASVVSLSMPYLNMEQRRLVRGVLNQDADTDLHFRCAVASVFDPGRLAALPLPKSSTILKDLVSVLETEVDNPSFQWDVDSENVKQRVMRAVAFMSAASDESQITRIDAIAEKMRPEERAWFDFQLKRGKIMASNSRDEDESLAYTQARIATFETGSGEWQQARVDEVQDMAELADSVNRTGHAAREAMMRKARSSTRDI